MGCRFDVHGTLRVPRHAMCLCEVAAGNRSNPLSSLSLVGRCCCVQAEIGDGTPEARTLEVSVSNGVVDLCRESTGAPLRRREDLLF